MLGAMVASDLLARTRQALNMVQLELALSVGASRRTGQRWDAGQSMPGPHQWIQLAERVYPIDAALAAELAAAGDTTLAALGLVKPPATGATAATRTCTDAHLVDSVICAAASAIDATPQAIRPALIAAFARAGEMGLSVDAINAVFTPAKKKKAPAG